MLNAHFRVFSINLSYPIGKTDSTGLIKDAPGMAQLKSPPGTPGSSGGLLQYQGLNSSGSITRGLTLGNKQNAVVNSRLNLQLSGKLNDEIEINALISDENIPLQPEGTTYHLQEFDKVFITLNNKTTKLTAGDYELNSSQSHFLKYDRKAQGGYISYSPVKDGSENKMMIHASGAVAKGKFVRNQFMGQEGNQGPYKLSGGQNESFFIVLSGTEKVFLDGELLTRGLENDYTIDYNLAEISFTTQRIIHQNSRIVVEFEYAQRNYARSIFTAGWAYSTQKTTTRLEWYSEADNKNKPLFQELSPRQKNILAQAGDQTQNAFDINIDSVAFSNDRILYRLTDSLSFDSVFVFSTDPQKAHYSLGFTFLGQGKGNYVPANSAANGRIFQWVSPINGVMQGTHQPVILLAAPEKKQMFAISSLYKINPNTESGIELAISQYDKNRFSSLDAQDNNGLALYIFAQNNKKLSEYWQLSSRMFYELSDQNFSAIDPFRQVEFERIWNINAEHSAHPWHSPGFSFRLNRQKTTNILWTTNSLIASNAYRGLRNSLDAKHHSQSNTLDYSAALLLSQGFEKTQFYNHRFRYEQHLHWFTLGLSNLLEHNTRAIEAQWLPSSRFFHETKLYIRNPDTLKFSYQLYRLRRSDYAIGDKKFLTDLLSTESGLRLAANHKPSHRFSAMLALRNISPDTTNLLKNMLSGQLDHFFRSKNGFLTSSLFSESQRGAERKTEYAYIEVPPGQGTHIWTDYNQNGIMELDEFEKAPFPDEANYIRLILPTQARVPTQSFIFNYSLHLDPSSAWRNEKGLRGILARFNNQLAWRIDNKQIISQDFSIPIIITSRNEDSLLVYQNTSLRNTLFFNRANPVFGTDFTISFNENKNLFSYGFEKRTLQAFISRSRFNINRNLIIQFQAGQTKKENQSEFFTNRNFNITSQEAEPSISFQKGASYRFTVFGGIKLSENIPDTLHEKATTSKAGAEFRWQIPQKGNLNARLQTSNIAYPYQKNTPIAFEMLEGLQEGLNVLWSISWQQNLSDFLQVSLIYNGRKSQGLESIHTGQIQMKALF